MRMHFFVFTILGACLLQAPQNIWAQSFGGGTNNGVTWGAGPTTDVTQSLGQFVLVINPSFSGAFAAGSVPGYSALANTFTSPLLYDPSTQINRSTALVLGNSAVVSAPVGSPSGPMVMSNSSDTSLMFSGNTNPLLSGLTYPVPTGSGATSPFTDAVFTQIQSFNLNNGAGFSVTTGTAAGDPNLPGSVGQVTSISGHSTGGTATNDFPARSFFDVFVDIDIALPATLGGGTVGLTNGAVYGGSGGTQQISGPGMPLMIVNSGITSFPPVVIYTHGNSTAVPVYIESTSNTLLMPDIGAPLGLMILAGHGAGYGTGSTGQTGTDENTGQPANQTTFENTEMNDLSMGGAMPVPYADRSWLTPYTPDTAAPEPSTLALLATFGGGAAVVWYRRRRRFGK